MRFRVPGRARRGRRSRGARDARGARGARAWLLPLAACACIVACHGPDTPVDSSPVKSISIALDQAQVTVGATARVTVTLFDSVGGVVRDRVASLNSLTPSIVSVTVDGVVTGLQPGAGQVRAAVGAVHADASIFVTNPVAASINLGRDSASLTLPGGSVQAIAAVTDATGHSLVNPAIVWSSSAPQIAAVNVAGLVIAVASGAATITAAIDGLTASMAVTVRPATVAGAPSVTAIAPPILRPGAAYTVTGQSFATTPGGNHVLVDGLPATVQTASATQLTIVLPTAGFVCEPARTTFLQVTADGLIGGTVAPLQTANQRALAPGASVIVANASEVRCNEIVPADGRWIVSVYNASRSAITPALTGDVLFAIRGVPGAPVGAPVGPQGSGASPATSAAASLTASTARRPSPAMEWAVPQGAPPPRTASSPASAREAAHLSVLERNLAALSTERPRASALVRTAPALVRTAPASLSAQIGVVGAITTLKIPNLDAADFCVSNIPVGFRTAYVGPHVAIVEDTTTVFGGKPTQKGQVDAYYTRLGDEFENVMWPILNADFGNPLAMDAQLGGPGRVVMVFSPRVNAMQHGTVVGFVASCDLFPVSQRPSSNLGAYFYAEVPTTSATGYATPDSRDQWLRQMRSTVIHEVKHITSFSERVARGFALEDLGWEEGGARIAEELYAREFYLNSQDGNTRYAQSIGCDIHYDVPNTGCSDRPVLLLRHFDALYAYMSGPEQNSPLGRAFATDFNFYAGAWSFLRWAADHFGVGEAQFFHDFTTSPVTGIANVEALTGRRWEESLGEWSLAAYLDDIGGFVSSNTRLRMPSWNYPDMWLGMCIDMGPCEDPSNPVLIYLRSTPFAPRQRSFGDFLVGIGSMVGGGFTLLDLSGPGATSQVIEVKALTSDADAPSTVRIAFARVR